MNEKLSKQLQFVIEIDKLKGVLRQTLLCDGSRQETDAEHSWHLAMMAMVLEEYAAEDINLSRVIRMALVHDLVEIYAGDTFAYDTAGNHDKEEREKAAADKLFSMLPEDQGASFRAMWEEFDEAKTSDAAFATALDRLQPLLANAQTQGHTWHLPQHPVTRAQVNKRMEPIRNGAPGLWEAVEEIIEDCIQKGYLKSE